MENWRQELMIIGFFGPIEQAAAGFFRQALQDKELFVKITHQFDIGEDGGVAMIVLLSRGEDKIIESKVGVKESNIKVLLTNHGVKMQNIVTMAVEQCSQNMLSGLIPIFYRHYIDTKFISKQNSDATVVNEVQAHGSGREESQQETRNNPLSGN